MENIAAGFIGFCLCLFIWVNAWIYEQWKNKLK
jgi:hypothetical protein